MVQPRPLSNASPSEAEVTASEGRITVHCRESDGASVASELYATYPIRFQVTTRPNSFIATGPNNEDSCIGQRKQVELESSDKGVKVRLFSFRYE